MTEGKSSRCASHMGHFQDRMVKPNHRRSWRHRCQNSPTYSALTTMPPRERVMSETTRRAVQAAWEQIGKGQQYQTPHALTEAIEAEAERLDELIGDETQRLRDQGIAQYRADNQGHHPPFLESVQIGNRARFQAEELILHQELGEQVETAVMEEDEEETFADQSWRDSPDRWRHSLHLMDDPTPEIDALTEEVWPEQTIRFRVTAAYLMQARYEDSQPIPETPDDPLKAEFTALVAEAIAERERDLYGTNG